MATIVMACAVIKTNKKEEKKEEKVILVKWLAGYISLLSYLFYVATICVYHYFYSSIIVENTFIIKCRLIAPAMNGSQRTFKPDR